tara:strand:+ start:691 stop:843 length:153 start_codon:yes stop_codon:yes gene_type:complete
VEKLQAEEQPGQVEGQAVQAEEQAEEQILLERLVLDSVELTLSTPLSRRG